MTIQTLLLLASHVVASSMIAKWKWSKLQEYLSLHRLLDMFPNMIAVENKRVGHHGGVGLKRHTIMSDQYPISMIHNALNFHGLGFS